VSHASFFRSYVDNQTIGLDSIGVGPSKKETCGESRDMNPEYIFNVLPFLFPFFWIGGCWAMSRKWDALAQRYPLTSPRSGVGYYVCSIMLNKVSYRNCIAIRICDDGITLRIYPIFPFHKPMFIRYSEFREVKAPWFYPYAFSIGSPVVGEIALGPIVGEDLRAKLIEKGVIQKP
jgi:hypothetical protein